MLEKLVYSKGIISCSQDREEKTTMPRIVLNPSKPLHVTTGARPREDGAKKK
jgi:hypothetical protein